MKHPLQTVHRQTFGLIYRILQPKPFQCKLNKNRFSSRTIVLIAILCFALFYYECFFMNVHYLDSKRNDHPEVCRRMKYVRAFENLKEDSLAEQLTIHSHFLNHKDDLSEVKKLLPITKLLLEKNKPICPLVPPDLRGRLSIDENLTVTDEDLVRMRNRLTAQNVAAAKLHDIYPDVSVVDKDQQKTNNSREKNKLPNFKSRLHELSFAYPINVSSEQFPLYSDQAPFGVNSPASCFPHRRTAIIIPYRKREEHLKLFLHHIHNFLAPQHLEYGIYIINLAGDVQFNRAKLLNIGYKEAMRHYHRYDCFIFHDVDLLPEDDRNIYTCHKDPKHMSVAIDIFDYKLPYPEIFGGVSALTPYQFELVNGYSNEYWGWGAEDDDMFFRLSDRCMRIYRISEEIARYHMAKHSADKGNEVRFERLNLLLGARNRLRMDGLSSLSYQVLHRDYQLLYNNITVRIGSPSNVPLTQPQIYLHYAAAAFCLILLYFLYFKKSKT